MAHIAGRTGLVAISTDGGSNYTTIGGVKDLSMKLDQKTIDVTDHDSGAWEEFLAGRKNVTLSFSGNFDAVDAGQLALWTSYDGGTTVLFRYRPGGATVGTPQWYGSGIITSVEDSSPNDGAGEFTCEVQMTGTLTKGAVS